MSPDNLELLNNCVWAVAAGIVFTLIFLNIYNAIK